MNDTQKMTEVHFFFDFQSPYSYLCWKDLQRRQKESFELKLHPLSMGSLIASYETLGPAQIPPKRDFLFRQCLRRAKKMGLPFKTPARLPFNPVEVLRLGTQSAGGHSQIQLVDAVFDAIWLDRVDMDDREKLESYLKSRLNFSPLENLQGDILKQARRELKENLKFAKDQGAFGVPSLVVNNELFWGHDSLEDFFLSLEGKDFLDGGEYQRFLDLF